MAIGIADLVPELVAIGIADLVPELVAIGIADLVPELVAIGIADLAPELVAIGVSDGKNRSQTCLTGQPEQIKMLYSCSKRMRRQRREK